MKDKLFADFVDNLASLDKSALLKDLFLEKIKIDKSLAKFKFRNEKLCLWLQENIESLTLKLIENNKIISVNNRHIVKNKKLILKNLENIHNNNIKVKNINVKCSLLLEELTLDMYKEFNTTEWVLNSNQYYVLHLTNMLRENYIVLEETQSSSNVNKKLVKETKQMVETVSFYILENYNLLQNLVNLFKDLNDLQERVINLKKFLPENIVDFLYENNEIDTEYKIQFIWEIVHGKIYPLWLRNIVFENLFKNTGDVLNRCYKFIISQDNWKNLSETEILNEYIKSYVNVEKHYEEKPLNWVTRGQLFDLRWFTRVTSLKVLKAYAWYTNLEGQKWYNLADLYNWPFNRNHIYDLKLEKDEESAEYIQEFADFRIFGEKMKEYEKEELEELQQIRVIRSNIRRDLKLFKEESLKVNKNDMKEEQVKLYEAQLKQKKKNIKLKHILGGQEQLDIYNQKVLRKKELDKQLDEKIKDIRDPHRIKKESDRIYIFMGKEYPSLGQYKEDCLKRDKYERNYEFYLSGWLGELFRDDKMREEQVQKELLKKQQQIKHFYEYGPLNEWSEWQDFIKNNNSNFVEEENIHTEDEVFDEIESFHVSKTYEHDILANPTAVFEQENLLKEYSHLKEDIKYNVKNEDDKYNIDFDRDKSRLYLEEFIRNDNVNNDLSLTDKGQIELLDDYQQEFSIGEDRSFINEEWINYNRLEDRFFALYKFKSEKVLEKPEFREVLKEFKRDVRNLLDTDEYVMHLKHKTKLWL